MNFPKKTSKFIYILGIILSLSCTKSDHPDSASYYPPPRKKYRNPFNNLTLSGCQVKDQTQYVYNVLRDVYYWYDKIPDLDYKEYKTPEDLLEAMRYSEVDQWSYISDKGTSDKYIDEGKFIGYGISYENRANKLMVNYIYQGSSAETVGLKRGDEIVAINGKTFQEILDNNLWQTVWGEDKVGVTTQIKILNYLGEESILDLTKGWIDIKTVHTSKIFNIESQKIGYLLFNNFLGVSDSELYDAFDNFKAENIDELIVDLRYNGGGLLGVSAYLGGLITGENTRDKTFAKIRFNNKHSDFDESIPFFEDDVSLKLNKISFLVSGDTCSASELLINGLKPFINVSIIGSTTCGKPVGMYPIDFCKKVLVPIMFETVNSLDEGGYFDGISPQCPADDDLNHPLGDPEESMLKEALYLMKNNQCSSDGKIFKYSHPPTKPKTDLPLNDLLRREKIL